MDLIKQLNKQLDEAQADAANPFQILDIKKIRGVNDIIEGEGKCGEGKCGDKKSHENEEEGFSKQQKADMKKLADNYRSGKGGNVSASDLKNYLGDDLEMIEYNPDEIEAMIPAIIKMTGLK